MKWRTYGLAFVAAAVFAANAAAQTATVRFRDWELGVASSGATKTCFIFSSPKRAEGDYTRRGDVYVIVARSGGNDDEVSVHAGYPYQPDSEVAMAIGAKTYTLFTQGDKAWAPDSETDRAIVAAMRAGTNMIVKGVSRRGTLTTDTYSLLGFTAAHERLAGACKT